MPIDDVESEGLEDVILTLNADPAYQVSASANQASALLRDDDVPHLEIIATDAAASEAGQDPATLTVTRSGDTSPR